MPDQSGIPEAPDSSPTEIMNGQRGGASPDRSGVSEGRHFRRRFRQTCLLVRQVFLAPAAGRPSHPGRVLPGTAAKPWSGLLGTPKEKTAQAELLAAFVPFGAGLHAGAAGQPIPQRLPLTQGFALAAQHAREGARGVLGRNLFLDAQFHHLGRLGSLGSPSNRHRGRHGPGGGTLNRPGLSGPRAPSSPGLRPDTDLRQLIRVEEHAPTRRAHLDGDARGQPRGSHEDPAQHTAPVRHAPHELVLGRRTERVLEPPPLPPETTAGGTPLQLHLGAGRCFHEEGLKRLSAMRAGALGAHGRAVYIAADSPPSTGMAAPVR